MKRSKVAHVVENLEPTGATSVRGEHRYSGISTLEGIKAQAFLAPL